MFGNCYVFSSNYMSLKSGAVNSLQLELFLPTPTSEYTYSESLGAHVTVYNKSERPFNPDQFEGIDVSAGTKTNIAIQRVFKRLLPQPFSGCIHEAKLFSSYYADIFANSNYTYRQQDCISLCRHYYISMRCNCSDLSLPSVSFGLDACRSSSQIGCVFTEYTNFLFDSNAINECYEQCPLGTCLYSNLA